MPRRLKTDYRTVRVLPFDTKGASISGNCPVDRHELSMRLQDRFFSRFLQAGGKNPALGYTEDIRTETDEVVRRRGKKELRTRWVRHRRRHSRFPAGDGDRLLKGRLTALRYRGSLESSIIVLEVKLCHPLSGEVLWASTVSGPYSQVVAAAVQVVNTGSLSGFDQKKKREPAEGAFERWLAFNKGLPDGGFSRVDLEGSAFGMILSYRDERRKNAATVMLAGEGTWSALGKMGAASGGKPIESVRTVMDNEGGFIALSAGARRSGIMAYRYSQEKERWRNLKFPERIRGGHPRIVSVGADLYAAYLRPNASKRGGKAVVYRYAGGSWKKIYTLGGFLCADLRLEMIPDGTGVYLLVIRQKDNAVYYNRITAEGGGVPQPAGKLTAEEFDTAVDQTGRLHCFVVNEGTGYVYRLQGGEWGAVGAESGKLSEQPLTRPVLSRRGRRVYAGFIIKNNKLPALRFLERSTWKTIGLFENITDQPAVSLRLRGGNDSMLFAACLDANGKLEIKRFGLQ